MRGPNDLSRATLRPLGPNVAHRTCQGIDAAQHFFPGLNREFEIPGTHSIPPPQRVTATNIAAALLRQSPDGIRSIAINYLNPNKSYDGLDALDRER